MKGKLVPHPVPALLKAQAPYNPRTIEPGNLKRLQNSLERFGQVENVILNTTTGHIVSGHQRVMAAHAAGLDTLDVLEVELTEGAEKALNVALNNPSLQGEWDMDKLKPVLDDVIGAFDIDLEDTGFDLEDYEGMFPQDAEVEEVPVPEPPQDPTTEPGDVYVIDGRHRVMCGDSTKGEDVGRLMAEGKADMVFTDPPYGIEYRSNFRAERFDAIEGDEGAQIDFVKTLTDIPIIYFCTRWDVAHAAIAELEKRGFTIKSWIVWYKSRGGMGDLTGAYRPTHETILYATKGRVEFMGGRDCDTWDISPDATTAYQHPTQKPVQLPTRAMKSHPAPTILDPFLGSGTTLIAADQLGRTCYGMEIDPRYCDVIIDRYKTYKPTAKIEVTHGTPDS